MGFLALGQQPGVCASLRDLTYPSFLSLTKCSDSITQQKAGPTISRPVQANSLQTDGSVLPAASLKALTAWGAAGVVWGPPGSDSVRAVGALYLHISHFPNLEAY